MVVVECLERGEVVADVRTGFGKRGRRQKLCLPLILGTWLLQLITKLSSVVLK